MNSTVIEVTNPFSEAVEFGVDALEEAGVDAVVAHARGAYKRWCATSMEERKALCKKVVAWFEANEARVAEDITRQMGKPLGQAKGEIGGLVERAMHMIDIADATLADDTIAEKEGFTRYIRHEPLGVVLDIAAWNYPLLIAVNVVVPAVLAGNAVIVKHSSKTPRCATAFEEAFRASGAPDYLVQAVAADHAVTESMIKHAGVDHVSFTGSVSGGKQVNRSAADRFIEVGLELGGKDPAYVCADADFEWAVANCVDGAFYNAGQSCCAVERIYVEAPIYDKFVEAYAEKARGYIVGDPMDEKTTLGPLASKGAIGFLKKQVADAVAAGARLVVSPDEFDTPESGYFLAPAVVADAAQSSSLMQEESFGPVIGITKVRSDEEAIRHMNDSPYGLTASIWTSDTERAIRIGEQIETGTFFMNRCDCLDPALPWCGVKDTGRGATLSQYGLTGFTRLKSMHLRTEIPK
jgi:acyl-CoA reductase-like NAD-dependent aldehyde dehydrogenase